MTSRLAGVLGTVAALLAVVAALAVNPSAQGKVDVSGKWIFTVQTEAGTTTPSVVLKQDGEKLSGHYSSQTLGEADLTGSVKGANVNFAFDADLMGQAVKVTYAAKVESAGTMKGTFYVLRSPCVVRRHTALENDAGSTEHGSTGARSTEHVARST
jgi:hypothetical protein